METIERKIEIDEIARKLLDWRNNGNADKARMELYSPDIESIEEGFGDEIGHVKGMAGLKKKGEWLSRDFEIHYLKASDLVVADNWFSLKYEIDLTNKQSGVRSTLSEIAVYKVDDGKIVKEHYFMW
jgi:hypothetical protein